MAPREPLRRAAAHPLTRVLAPVLGRRRVGVIGMADFPDLAPDAPRIDPADPTHRAAFGAVLGDDAATLLGARAVGNSRAVFVYVGATPPGVTACGTMHHVHLLVRLLNGDLVVDAAFPTPQAARLHGAIPTDPAVHLALWSDTAPPQPRLGLHLGGARPARSDADRVQPPSLIIGTADRAASVRLARRLQLVESRALAAAAKREGSTPDRADDRGAAAFDPATGHHPWPLMQQPRHDQTARGLYDVRPDDAVIIAARQGETFLERHDLRGDEPDFSGAIAALNGIQSDQTHNVPDVSIIIPVHGQLAYTLNALDSLLRHRSRYSAEIIVIDDASPDGATAMHLPRIMAIRSERLEINRGFIGSCNHGAALARGRFVLLLNNDVRVADGWLDALIDSFALFPSAGLVGSKMIYPDGTLQEAGNILWRDGSAWNYGRGDDPNRPQYCHAREADYISGCSIALPTDLWRALGGFDPHFAPAYAEDADLCQRVIQAGRKIWFQPLSRIIHYEGRTSGISVEHGVKSYQVANLRRLFLRWRHAFELHRFVGDNPYLERERRARRRILVVDSVTPTPDQDAGSVQTALALRCCAMAGYKPHFVPEDNWLYVPGYTGALQARGVECAYAPFETQFDSYIRRYGWLFDAVIVYRVHVMARCIEKLRLHAPQAALIFHVADLHFLRAQRQAELESNPAGLAAAEALKEVELDIVQRADCTVTHSTVEAEILAAETPDARVVVWPLMMDRAGTSVGFETRRDVCFLGGYRHPPNEDAAVHFATAVLPLLKADIPDLRFVIAGANPTARVQTLAGPDVVVTGQIADLAELFDRCRVFVCPLRVGAGAKGKIASALSHGIPVVSTSIGVEGAGLVDGTHVLVADTDAAMAAAVRRLYVDRDLWGRLSRAGPALIAAAASLEMGRHTLDRIVETALRRKLELDG